MLVLGVESDPRPGISLVVLPSYGTLIEVLFGFVIAFSVVGCLWLLRVREVPAASCEF